MERSFLSQKWGGGGRGVKEKQHGSASNTAKDTSVAFSTVDEHVNTPSVNLEKPLGRSSYVRAMIELRANGRIERYYHGG
ncbi:hypothetical protein Tco_1047538, partial [Tanacetum coccineum]